MHHGKTHNHISSSLPDTLISGFREFDEECPSMVDARRAPLITMHHDTQDTHSSSGFPFTLISGLRDVGEGYSIMAASRRTPGTHFRPKRDLSEPRTFVCNALLDIAVVSNKDRCIALLFSKYLVSKASIVQV